MYEKETHQWVLLHSSVVRWSMYLFNNTPRIDISIVDPPINVSQSIIEKFGLGFGESIIQNFLCKKVALTGTILIEFF